MELNFLYLGSKGLSTSKAGHLKNVAKEIAETYASQLSNAALFSEAMLLDNENIVLDKHTAITNLSDLCQQEGKLYALSAWLGEGLKEKDETMLQIKTAQITEILDEKEEDVPKQPDMYELEPQPTEKDIKLKWTIRERAEYLAAEAKAASIGKKIHNRGKLAVWKEEIRSEKPVRFDKVGEKQTVVVKRTFLYDVETIETAFFDLQKAHRHVNERVNYYTARLKQELSLAQIANSEKNEKTINDYQSEIKKWEHTMAIRRQKAEKKRAELINTLANMKIIVPEDLTDIIEYVEKIAENK